MNGKTLPQYQKIENDLRDGIEQQRLKAGDQILTEEALCTRYGVSRMTVRKALDRLSADGYINRIPGKGTFVATAWQPGSAGGRGLSREIAVLIPCVTESLYPGIIRGVEDVCNKNGYHLILGNYDARPEKEREYMVGLLARGLSGFVISPSYSSGENDYYRELVRQGVPFVLTDVAVNGVEADLVQTDNVKGAYLGARSLIASGCRRIAFLSGWRSSSSSRERFAGYWDALAEAGIRVEDDLRRVGEFTEEFGYSAGMDLLTHHAIDGVFCANEPITIGLFRAIAELNGRRQEEVKIASFDEPGLPTEFSGSITLVTQPRYEIGRTAAEMLLERLREPKNGSATGPRRILLEPRLVKQCLRVQLV